MTAVKTTADFTIEAIEVPYRYFFSRYFVVREISCLNAFLNQDGFLILGISGAGHFDTIDDAEVAIATFHLRQN